MKKTLVILSGGVGSRLWPLSRKSRPKQYLKLFNDKNLFRLTVERNSNLTDNLLVVGNRDNHELSEKSLEEAEIDNYNQIIEASPRNTAAAVAFAAFNAESDDLLLITPADHIIENMVGYEASVNRAFELAEEGKLVTFGIQPTRPETGYGYIESEGETVLSFREKPDLETAQKFLDSGNFFWNSGIFCFKAGVFLNELKTHRPKIYEASLAAYENMSGEFMPEKESMAIPSESIDYAVMENSDNIAMVPGNFEWSDLGSFESIHDYFSSNGENGYIKGRNLVMSNKHVEIIGLENISVIETDDALLILPNSESQKVKGVFELLEKEKPGLVE